ncbi:hypothetical protein [Pedobacter suwonensis]|uniref:hypothetical protein n=1 Tax=Pedobacter suwonensis TaxID=332999 RepID=UPI0036ABF782
MAKNSERIKISFAKHFVVPACAGSDSLSDDELFYEKFKDLSTTVEMTDFFEIKAIKRSFATLRMTAKEEPPLLHAICITLPAPCYRPSRFPPEKARKSLQFPLHTPTTQGRIKAGALGISQG